MGRAQRWASVVLAGLLAPCLFAADPRSALSAQPVLGWTLDGFIEAGGMDSFGERGSSKFNQYRDMDDGFLGEIDVYGEKKDSPYFFELRAKNPARSDQLYEGAFGRYGWFQVDLSWNRTPVVLSNTAGTIYQTSDDALLLPSSPVRNAIATTFTTAPTTPGGRANIQATINSLLQPVSLGFNTEVGTLGLKVTPLQAVRFDFEYKNIRQDGTRPLGAQMAGSFLGPVQELAIPIENYTHQFKFGAEYARQNWGLQFNYLGSYFDNTFQGYTWDNPTAAANTPATNARDRLSAAPDNSANTFSLTGTAALPFRTRINGTFAYTMLRQNQVFEFSTGNTTLTGRTNSDDAGKNSADAQSNLLLGNIVLTSRPINPLSITARYRYYEYQNDMPQHTFTNTVYPTGGTDVASAGSQNTRYTKQNAGIDFGYRPIRTLSLKAGYEYEHWNRADYGLVSGQSFSNSENIGKFAADVTPVDWFLGRLTYTYGDRSINGHYLDLTTTLPQSIKYNYSPRTRNRVDGFFQFMFWEKLTPSISVGYAVDDYRDNQFGLTKDDYFNAGFNLGWSPLPRLTLSGDFTYELYNYEMANRFVSGALPGTSANTWTSKSQDEFYNVGFNAVVDIVPKRFDVTLGYTVTFGYTTYQNATPYQSAATSSPQATAFPWPKVQNVLQTARIVGRFRLTDHISLRGGFAYERYNEKNWARDPMQPFMGNYDSPTYPTITYTAQGAQSVWLGATQPNYESYTFAGFVRYDF